jgi:phage terminase large subunit GpA-like protein
VNGHPGAQHLVASRLAASIRPPIPVALSRWLSENLVLVDGPQAGELWSAGGAPYLTEIADCLGDDHPANLVTVRKSQQTGASILALGWCLYIADREPANTLYAAPTDDALRKLNSGKLQPLIDAWHKRVRREIIVPQTSRSGTGSTTYEKVFPGGRLWLANANSVTDLSSVTAAKGVKDEVSKWEMLENDADPENLFFGRFTSFRRIKSYKILEISTPEVDVGDDSGNTEGHCRIDRSFKRSDMRFWNCACPECGRLFVHHFERFKIDDAHPHRSVYPCFCGHDITETERVIAVRDGRWIPSVDEPGHHPGFHIDAFISLMMSYEAIAEDWINSQKTETAKKDFHNLVLGLPYQFRGDAPDHEKLYDRREEYSRGHIPPGALLLTIAADVQARGIYYEVLASAPNRESWVIEADYLDGETTDVDAGAFGKLTALHERRWPDAYGNAWLPNEFGIDANYRTNTVYEWTRRHAGTKALQGRDGWGRPALGMATPQDVDYRGRKIRNGAQLRGVGTWPLKSTFYSYLALVRETKNGAAIYPAGFCHFGKFLDAIYFRQLTAEHLVKVKRRGRERQEWREHGNAGNHYLDCRIYNLALADAYFVSFTADDWADLAKERGIPADLRQPDLFTPRQFQAPAASTNAAGGIAEGGDAAPSSAPQTGGRTTLDIYYERLAALNKGL